MVRRIIILVILFLLHVHTRSFTNPGEYDFFHIKKLMTVTANSLNVLLIFSAPLIPDGCIADGIYGFYGNSCHQLPDRSFELNGKTLPVCARCTGIALGQLVGELNCIVWNPVNPYRDFRLKKSIIYCIMFSSFLLPLVIDGGIQFVTDYESNNMLRLATGVLYGIGMTTLMDEIVRIVDFYL